MTKLQEIRSLQPYLPDRINDIKSIKECFINDDYNAHHSVIAILTDTIGDYQVIRKFDIEIDLNMDWEYEIIDSLSEEERKEYLDEDECLTDNFYETFVNEDNLYEFEIGEFVQIWYNVKDHTIYKLGKMFKEDPRYCDFSSKWTNLNYKNTEAKKIFLQHFGDVCTEQGFYKDMTVHQELINAGYSGIDALNWCYGCGDDENLTTEAKFIKGKELDKFYTDILLNRTQTATHIRIYGLDSYMYIHSIEDEAQQKEVIAALRVCNRHHYKIQDHALWRDMVEQLFKLEKDLHNPHYVCPANLKEAHDKISAEYRRNEAKIRERKRQRDFEKQVAEAAKELGKFVEKMQAFLDLCFTNEHLVIRPLRSPAEYLEEGHAMHHCVASYRERYNSLILSARNKDNERIATIEVSLHNYQIIQIRGKCNAKTEYDQEIAVLLTKNMSKIRKANKKQQKINAAKAA